MMTEQQKDFIKENFLESPTLETCQRLCGLMYQAGVNDGMRIAAKQLEQEMSESQANPIVDEGFLLFWETYDKRVGRASAIKAWKRLTKSEKTLAIAHASVYVADTPDKQYRKNPSTYLNQKAWQDERILSANAKRRIQQESRVGEANALAEALRRLSDNPPK